MLESVHHFGQMVALQAYQANLPLTMTSACCCCPIAHSHAEQTTKATLDKTTRQIAITSESQQLLDCDWIYLIDSGGQIEFLEALPAFL